MSPEQESPDTLEPIETDSWQTARSRAAVDAAHGQLLPLHVRDVSAIVQRDLKVAAAKRGLKMGAMLEAAWLCCAENGESFDDFLDNRAPGFTE
jgi:hypothetical protein